MDSLILRISLEATTTIKAEEKYTLNIDKFFNMLFINQNGREIHNYNAMVFSMQDSSGNSIPVQIDCTFSGHLSYETKNITQSLFDQCKKLEQIWNKIEKTDDGFVIVKSDGERIEVRPCSFASSLNGYIIGNNSQVSNTTSCGSWTYSKMMMNSSIINQRFDFKIVFEQPDNVSVNCPDYMWYACIPNEIECDFTDMNISFDDGETLLTNQISQLNPNTPLPMNEWIENENILYSKRCRMRFKGQDLPCLDKKKNILVRFRIKEHHDTHGNRQFFTGILVAFLISFFADFTRNSEILDQYYFFDSIMGVQLLSVLFPICVISSYIFIITPFAKIISQYSSKLKKLIRFIHITGLFCSIFCPVSIVVIYPILSYYSFFYNNISILFTISFIIGEVGIALFVVFLIISQEAEIDFRNYL